MSRTRSATRRIVLETVAAIAASLLTLGLVTAPAGAAPITAGASAPNGSAPNSARGLQPPQPVVTRAALDPALVAGRGADVGFVEQEAENGGHQRHGHRPGPRGLHAARRGVGPLGGPAAAPASTSSSPCRRRPTRSPCATASRTRRPAAASPRRSTSRSTAATARTHDADLAVRLALQPVPVLQRPERRPAAPRLVDHRVRAACRTATTPTPVITTPFRPIHFYDEQRLLLGRTYRAGDKVRLTAPAGSAGRGRVIDLLDSQLVGLPQGRRSWRRTCCCSAPTRPAGATRPTRSTRPSRSPRSATSRSTSRRARTR